MRLNEGNYLLKDVPSSVAEADATATKDTSPGAPDGVEWVEAERRGKQAKKKSQRAHSKENT